MHLIIVLQLLVHEIKVATLKLKLNKSDGIIGLHSNHLCMQEMSCMSTQLCFLTIGAWLCNLCS